jgi:hypothetical protein
MQVARLREDMRTLTKMLEDILFYALNHFP